MTKIFIARACAEQINALSLGQLQTATIEIRDLILLYEREKPCGDGNTAEPAGELYRYFPESKNFGEGHH